MKRVLRYCLRELIENMSAPKHQKLSSLDQQYLVELLVEKDKEVKKVLRLARMQAKIEGKMTVLQTRVNKLVCLRQRNKYNINKMCSSEFVSIAFSDAGSPSQEASETAERCGMYFGNGLIPSTPETHQHRGGQQTPNLFGGTH